MNTNEQVLTHMEYLGYEIKVHEDDQNVLLCSKPGYTSLLVNCLDNMVRFYANYSLNATAKSNLDKVYEYVNELNTASYTTTFNTADNLLIMTNQYIGKYDKSLFSSFLGTIEHDTADVLSKNSKTDVFLGSDDNYINEKTRLSAVA